MSLRTTDSALCCPASQEINVHFNTVTLKAHRMPSTDYYTRKICFPEITPRLHFKLHRQADKRFKGDRIGVTEQFMLLPDGGSAVKSLEIECCRIQPAN